MVEAAQHINGLESLMDANPALYPADAKAMLVALRQRLFGGQQQQPPAPQQ